MVIGSTEAEAFARLSALDELATGRSSIEAFAAGLCVDPADLDPDNPEAEAVAVVPLPDHPEVHISYEHLLKLECLKGPSFLYFPLQLHGQETRQSGADSSRL